MSKLKAHRIVGMNEECACIENDFYLKSEADKVIVENDKEIAELKADIADLRDDKKSTDTILDERNAEIAELKADYKEALDRLQTANLIKDEQLAATRHQKYKRCLDKAKYWVAVSYQCVDDKHRQRAERHHYKWLEIAEKFKDKAAK